MTGDQGSAKTNAGVRGAAKAPRNRVLTPGGFRDPSLVHEVPAGFALRRTDRALKPLDLAPKEVIDLAEAAAELAEAPTLGSGWIAYTYWVNTTGSPITLFSATWHVPPAPAAQENQTIFLFSAMLNAAKTSLLQPVLQWGSSITGGGAFWSIASWQVTLDGQVFHTPLVQVNPGDMLTGVITQTGQSGGSFDYRCEFQGITATMQRSLNIPELIGCSATLEAYRITQCSAYPAAQRTTFGAIRIQTDNMPAALNWDTPNPVSDCGQHASVTNDSPDQGEVDIYYAT